MHEEVAVFICKKSPTFDNVALEDPLQQNVSTIELVHCIDALTWFGVFRAHPRKVSQQINKTKDQLKFTSDHSKRVQMVSDRATLSTFAFVRHTRHQQDRSCHFILRFLPVLAGQSRTLSQSLGFRKQGPVAPPLGLDLSGLLASQTKSAAIAIETVTVTTEAASARRDDTDPAALVRVELFCAALLDDRVGDFADVLLCVFPLLTLPFDADVPETALFAGHVNVTTFLGHTALATLSASHLMLPSFANPVGHAGGELLFGV